MKKEDLIEGRIYRLDNGNVVEFGYWGQKDYAVMHPPGEPGMQSSIAVKAEDVVEEVTDYVPRKTIGETLKDCPTDRQKLLWVLSFLDSTRQVQKCQSYIENRRKIVDIDIHEAGVSKYVLGDT